MTIETKFKIGSSVWILEGLQTIKVRVAGVDVFVRGDAPMSIVYRFAVYKPRHENEVFETRQELLDNIQ